jgi:hypothetical protein
MEKVFKDFKAQFGKLLAESTELDLQDVLHLIQPLALEDITDRKLWDNFASVLMSREHKIP